MNIKSLTIAALALLAALSAHAQTVGAGDIIVGFRGNTSVTNNLLVAAGNVSTLATYTTETLIGNFNTQLTSNLGLSSWSTATSAGSGQGGVFWGAVGTAGSTNVFAGSIWDATVPATLGTANSLNGTDWSTLPQTGTANTKISALNSLFNSGSAALTGDGISKTVLASNSSSWSGSGTSLNTGSTAFGTFSPNNNGFTGVHGANIVDGTTYSALDLYSITANASEFLGTFALYQNGNLTFTAFQAIPEPSTYAAILGVATLGFAALRRRKQALIA